MADTSILDDAAAADEGSSSGLVAPQDGAAGAVAAERGDELRGIARQLHLEVVAGESNDALASRYAPLRAHSTWRAGLLSIALHIPCGGRISAAMAPQPLLPPLHAVIKFVDTTVSDPPEQQRAKVVGGDHTATCFKRVLQTRGCRMGRESGERVV